MKLRHIVPTLAALATIPTSHAVEVMTNDDVKLSLGLRLQSRLEYASATAVDGSGNDAGVRDIWEKKDYPDAAKDDANNLNFMFRRVRLKFKGSYKDDLKFKLTFHADKAGKKDNGKDNNFVLHSGSISKSFKSDDIKHTVGFGYGYMPTIIGAEDSTSKMLFATQRMTSHTDVWKGRYFNMNYTLAMPVFGLEVALGENDTGSGGSGNADNNNYLLGLRATTPIKEEWAIGKRKESYCVKEGFAHELGIGLGFEMYDVSREDGGQEDGTVLGLDYLARYDALTAGLDLSYRMQGEASSVTNPGATAPEDLTQLIVNLQAGYAFCLENEMVVEPAIRLAMIDDDDEADKENTVYSDEGGSSGTYIDLGCNIYFDGHNHKMNIGLQFFSPEEGDGDATIFRVQHCLDF